jgi:hypothetical protein
MLIDSSYLTIVTLRFLKMAHDIPKALFEWLV